MRNEALWNVMGRYGSATGHYGMLRKHNGCCRALCNISEHCSTLRNVTEALWKRYEVLQTVTKHYGALWNVMERQGSIAGHYGMLWEHYIALTERYGTITENIDFAPH